MAVANLLSKVKQPSNDKKKKYEQLSPMSNDEKMFEQVLKWFVKRKEKNESNDLEEKKQDAALDQEFAILLTTGSLNPIHTGHIDMMNFAKKELSSYNEANYIVIGGFVSASHDKYVMTKPNYIRSENRIDMIKLAIKESDWIECDEWESKQSGFVDYPYVCQEFKNEISKNTFEQKMKQFIVSKLNNDINKIELPNISLFYVCGRDHADKCGLWQGVYCMDLVAKSLVVPRPDDNKYFQRKSNQDCIIVNMPDAKMLDDRSSTQIRKYILDCKGNSKQFDTKEIEKSNMLHPKVLEYIETNLEELYQQLKHRYYKDPYKK